VQRRISTSARRHTRPVSPAYDLTYADSLSGWADHRTQQQGFISSRGDAVIGAEFDCLTIDIRVCDGFALNRLTATVGLHYQLATLSAGGPRRRASTSIVLLVAQRGDRLHTTDRWRSAHDRSQMLLLRTNPN